MNILIIGDKKRADELKLKLPEEVVVHHTTDFSGDNIAQYEVVFDLNFDDDDSSLGYLLSVEDIPVFVCSVKRQLAEMIYASPHAIKATLIGMNTLPTFIDRSKMEFSLYRPEDQKHIERLSKNFGWEYLIVNDRVGMVSPRILFMIINEACFTLQEGTASVQDIDIGMKLGTNYPFGPFEWCDRIGIKDVYETLEAMYKDTRDERYKICSLLKTKYLRRETFYL